MKYYVPKSVKQEDAIKNTYKWLESGLAKAKGLASGSKIEEAYLAYVPFWRVKSDVVGWIFGQEKKSRSTGSSTDYYYEDKEIKIQDSYDWTTPACDIAELGVKKINLEGDEIKPVNFEELQQQGMLFNIISSEKEITDLAKERFSSRSNKAANLDNVTFQHLDLVREEVYIVYYPLWVVRYVFANRIYQVVVDGQDGTICYGKAPGSTMYRAVIGILGTAFGMFLATFFEAFYIFKASGKTPWIIYIIALILGIAVMTWAYKKFRFGGEVEEGTGLEEDKGDNVLSKTQVFGISTGSDLKGMAKTAIGSAAAGAVLGALFSGDD